MSENKKTAEMPMMGPGGRRGPGMGMVEKPKNGKDTLKRLLHYFSVEKKMAVLLMLVVVVMVGFSIYAPKLQSNAIDFIAAGKFNKVIPVLVVMLVIYGFYALCSLAQSLLSAHLSQRIVKRMREDLFHI